MNSPSLAGGTVVVIGGSSGIGLAAGALLNEAGARVVLVGRDEARLAAAAKTARTGEAPVLTAAADASDEAGLARLFDEVGEAGQVDHVLVTAGSLSGGLLGDAPRAAVEDAVNGRIWGAYAAARVAAPRLRAGGSITFSSGTYVKRPVPGAAAAIAGITAVEGLTRALAVELAPRRLRVNALRFGVFDTPLSRGAMGLDSDEAVVRAGSSFPLGRLGDAREAASAALFLMTNGYVTGTVLTVDGGLSLA